jgi:NAD(P)-dependent dehydrogenase (short-subunit alcohol dehydrogenase family)
MVGSERPADFAGRRIVVSGASSGLGRACSHVLSLRGASLVLIGRNDAALESTRSGLSGSGHEIVRLDLDDLDSIEPTLTPLLTRGPRIYGLCHAAGVVITRPLRLTTPSAVASVMRVNVLAGIELARVVTQRAVMDPDGGSVLFVSSVYGKVGAAGQTAYAASKGAIAAAARAMAAELARRRIRVNTISPGLVRTPMTDGALALLTHDQVSAIEQRHLLGTGSPNDVAHAVAFLLAPSTSWITGADLAVDGGFAAH